MPGPKTTVIGNWQQNAIDVYCTTAIREGVNDGTITRYNEDGRFVEVPLANEPNEGFSDRPAPTFRIPMPVLDEIVKFIEKEYPTRQNDDQIKDLRATRDRLLTLVEIDVLAGRDSLNLEALKELRK